MLITSQKRALSRARSRNEQGRAPAERCRKKRRGGGGRRSATQAKPRPQNKPRARAPEINQKRARLLPQRSQISLPERRFFSTLGVLPSVEYESSPRGIKSIGGEVGHEVSEVSHALSTHQHAELKLGTGNFPKLDCGSARYTSLIDQP